MKNNSELPTVSEWIDEIMANHKRDLEIQTKIAYNQAIIDIISKIDFDPKTIYQITNLIKYPKLAESFIREK
ncbi:hypothetical protein KGQ29_03885 [Patescibacteria group bacterium]|nr:hypothetical protein [Patescibacteria group bacterium]